MITSVRDVMVGNCLVMFVMSMLLHVANFRLFLYCRIFHIYIHSSSPNRDFFFYIIIVVQRQCIYLNGDAIKRVLKEIFDEST